MSLGRELLKGHLPTLVLAVLAEEPCHGYALCKQLRQRSGNALRLGEGTLYPLLHRLEGQGLIEARWEKPSTGRPRKVYRITSSGRHHLKAQRTELATLFELLSDVLGKGWATP